MDTQRLAELSQVDITKIDKNDLVDLNTVCIDKDAPLEVRFQQFLDQIKNPYAYRVGDVAVKVAFSESGKPLREIFTNYLMSLKEHS